jgi:hypothetical protein|tara:strand:+ start:136 stop:1152 length:1017 start_codon:yes stop_codon:yes gene_type:complete
MKLFDMKWPDEYMGKFEVKLNYPLHITDDIFSIKEHGKRVLLEMVDTYPKLILAYSGGSDSAFILCCINDLINERKITKNTIEIVQGVYTAKDIILTPDHKRATKFAKSLNLNPRIYKYDVDKNWDDIEKFILDMQLSGSGCVNSSCQYLLSMKQDGVVIQHRGPGRYTGLSFDNENLIFSNNWCVWDIIDNIINFDTWDKDIYSSFITPFRLTSRPINTQPYSFGGAEQNIDMDERTLVRIQKYLHKFILYFQCYPEMTEIFGKFVTIDWGMWTKNMESVGQRFRYRSQHYRFVNEHERIQRFRKMIDNSPENYAFVKSLNGNKFTIKDLLNYEDYI